MCGHRSRDSLAVDDKGIRVVIDQCLRLSAPILIHLLSPCSIHKMGKWTFSMAAL